MPYVRIGKLFLKGPAGKYFRLCPQCDLWGLLSSVIMGMQPQTVPNYVSIKPYLQKQMTGPWVTVADPCIK